MLTCDLPVTGAVVHPDAKTMTAAQTMANDGRMRFNTPIKTAGRRSDKPDSIG